MRTGPSESRGRRSWNTAREWLDGLLDGLPLERERDPAGNDWWTLRGESESAVLIGGHIDSVPNGGWLDGSLNVVAGAEVLRRIAEAGTPPVTVRLVNWADEEGARFGRSLFGSSAAAGSMRDQDELRELTDQDGISLPEALAENGVDLDRAARGALAARERRGVPRAAHRAGPRPRVDGHSARAPCSAPTASSAGGSPGRARPRTPARRRWTSAATRSPARRSSRSRSARSRPRSGTAPSAPREASSADPGSSPPSSRPRSSCSTSATSTPTSLAELLRQAQEASERFAAEENLEVAWERIWNIEPILFDPALVDLCDEACREVAGTSHRLPSGPLHDAAEVAARGRPDVMLFVQSLRGLSHTKLEDTREEHLELAVAALDRLADSTIARVSDTIAAARAPSPAGSRSGRP